MAPALLALFGIDNDSVNLALNLLILFLAVIYFALVYWTYADAKRRIEDPVLIGTATLAALIPFIGPMIYTILRPPEFIEDVRERELETRASELRLRRLTETSCPRCEHPTERDWLTCPECRTNLKDPCGNCGRAVDPQWTVCPHCQAPVAREGQAASGQRRPRRRVSSQGSTSSAPQQQRQAPQQRQPSQQRQPPQQQQAPQRPTSRQASARAAAQKREAARKEAGQSSEGSGRPQRRARSDQDASDSADGAPSPPKPSQQRPASEDSEGDAPRPRRSTPTN